MRPIDADLLEKQLLELAGDNPPMYYYFSNAIGVIRKQPTANISKMERTTEKFISDDLISREVVLQFIEEIKCNSTVPKNYGTLLDIMRFIRNQPIAYDVDKVVEQLEDKIEITWSHDYLGGRKDAFNEAIEIVKGGGVDE